MTDRIEPGCLAVTLPEAETLGLPVNALVHVIDRVSDLAVTTSLTRIAKHCPKCAERMKTYRDAFGVADHWICRFEEPVSCLVDGYGAVLHERVLRRLPPPLILPGAQHKREGQPA